MKKWQRNVAAGPREVRVGGVGYWEIEEEHAKNRGLVVHQHLDSAESRIMKGKGDGVRERQWEVGKSC